MKAVSFAFLVGVFCLGCMALDPGEATLDLPIGVEADGSTAHEIMLCSDAMNPLDEVSTTLTATSGRFEPSGADSSRSVTLVLAETADGCATVSWIPDDQPRLVRFEARVEDERIAVEELTTLRTEIESLTLGSSSPFLASDGESQRALMVELRSASGGGPSQGTVVDLRVLSIEPSSRLAILSESELRTASRDNVTLFVAADTLNVVVEAELTGDDQPTLRDCLTLVAPGQPTPSDECP